MVDRHKQSWRGKLHIYEAKVQLINYKNKDYTEENDTWDNNKLLHSRHKNWKWTRLLQSAAPSYHYLRLPQLEVHPGPQTSIVQIAAWTRKTACVLGNLQIKVSIYFKCFGCFLHRAVSSPLECSKRFTLHPLADLFILTPTWLLWEVFSHAAITVQRIFTHIFQHCL